MTPYHADDAVTIHHGNALNLPLEDASVDLVVTSPPFLNLRSYQDGGQHYDGQIGTGTREEFLCDLWAATAEMVRVLKHAGSIFVELGDSYTDKSLNLSPHRYAIGCTDRLGLTLRAEIVWSRPNGLPESVTDRVRRNHSVWFHLTKEPRYFAAVDEIRESYQPSTISRNRYAVGSHTPDSYSDVTRGVLRDARPPGHEANPLGKLPGSVWTIPTEPLTVPDHLGLDHFAAFPLEWPLRIIRGWSPSGICTVCGEGRRPVAAAKYHPNPKGGYLGYRAADDHSVGQNEMRPTSMLRSTTITGYACACTPYTDHPGTGESSGPHGLPGQDPRAQDAHATRGQGWGPDANFAGRPRVGPWREYHFDQWTTAPTRPAIILDPFMGTGTTLLAAKALGRCGVGNDLSKDYCRLAQWRCTDPGELAKAMRVDKPAPVMDGQGALDLEVTG